MKILIPFKTPSVNHLYFNYRNIRILTKEARQLKKDILELINNMTDREPVPSTPLKVTTRVYENWYYKNGEVRRADVANREKFLIDAVFDALGVDDKFIFQQTLIKEQSDDKEFAVIEIDGI